MLPHVIIQLVAIIMKVVTWEAPQGIMIVTLNEMLIVLATILIPQSMETRFHVVL